MRSSPQSRTSNPPRHSPTEQLPRGRSSLYDNHMLPEKFPSCSHGARSRPPRDASWSVDLVSRLRRQPPVPGSPRGAVTGYRARTSRNSRKYPCAPVEEAGSGKGGGGGGAQGYFVRRRATWHGHVAQTDLFLRPSSPSPYTRENEDVFTDGRASEDGSHGVSGSPSSPSHPQAPGMGWERVRRRYRVNRGDDTCAPFRQFVSSSF